MGVEPIRTCVRAVDEEHAAEHVAVTGEMLGEAVDHQVGAVRKRLKQQRRREGGVDDAGGAGAVRGGGHRGNVDEADQRIGDHLGHHGGDVLTEDGTHQVAVVSAAVQQAGRPLVTCTPRLPSGPARSDSVPP